jgi:hypothetical protein
MLTRARRTIRKWTQWGIALSQIKVVCLRPRQGSVGEAQGQVSVSPFFVATVWRTITRIGAQSQDFLDDFL